MTVWGNHSTTQFPDISHAQISSRPAAEVIDDSEWVAEEFIPAVQKRGAAVIEARGASSAASAANAAIMHVRDWCLGTPAGDWVSMGIPSDGSYGVPEGLICGLSLHCFLRRVFDRRGLSRSTTTAARAWMRASPS